VPTVGGRQERHDRCFARSVLSVAGRRRLVTALLGVGVAAGAASAQEAPSPPPPAQTPEARPTGLPSPIAWTFHFDAGWGSFGFANSLFANPKEPGVVENLSDQWFEGYVKPSLGAVYTLASSSQIYGAVSAVGERTYGSVPAEFGEDVSSFQAEDLAIGWRSGAAIPGGEHVVDLSVGRAQYRLGHGMLLWDGAAEGGSRGGYWTNARRAFELAAIARVRPGPHTLEAFYLDRDELPEADSGSRLWGLNYELTLGQEDTTTLGATYMRWRTDPGRNPARDGLHVVNLRAYTAPLAALPDLSFEVEYASERNGAAREADAWTAQAAYALGALPWTPTISYRRAFFEGDDPATPANESFDPLLPGFHDWGTWWQGEIAGEYFLGNSNLVSNLARLHVDPADSLGAGLLFFTFSLDHPSAAGEGVTASDVAVEADLYVDWKVNGNVTVSVVGAFADPGAAVRQFSGRTKHFVYGMVYVGYAF
jgi:hypothetical protein